MKIHILRICGTFMGGVALLARQMGHEVTGSDQAVYPPMSDALQETGITILNESEDLWLTLQSADVVIIGNALSRGDPWVERVLDAGLSYDSGPGWLAKNLLHQRQVIAVAGTHGKTTTTSMITWILRQAGVDAGYLIGGVPKNLPTTAHLGKSECFVIEADEYDTAFFDKQPKFMHYHPRTLVLTNLEFDHADIYENLEAIKKQFHYLVRTVPAMGTIIYNQNDNNIRDVLSRGLWSLSQSFGEGGQWNVKHVMDHGRAFKIQRAKRKIGRVFSSLLGGHNVQNALAAAAAAFEEGIAASEIIKGLSTFKGVKRRLECYEIEHGVTVFDDFAHHPTAIEKTLKTVHGLAAGRRLLVVLQFGSNTMRGGSYGDRVLKALECADQVFLFNAPDEIADGRVQTFTEVDGLQSALHVALRPNDCVLVMSNKNLSNVVKGLGVLG